MSHVRVRIALLFVLGGVGSAAMCPASTALAAATLRVDASVQGAYIELPSPAFGVDGATSGSLHGAIAFKESGSGTFSGKFFYADAHGTLRGSDRGTQQPSAGTTVAFSDKLTVTQATGRYRGLQGVLRAHGSADAQTGFITERIAGTLRHGRPARPPVAGTGSHPYRATATVIDATPGPVATVPGAVRGLSPGGGLIVLRSPQGATTVTESYTYYDGRGSISGTFTLIRNPQPDGSVQLTGKPGAAHGTGRYAHVHSLGATSLAGSRDAMTGVVTITFTGTLRLS
jgi:hypothetical protein